MRISKLTLHNWKNFQDCSVEIANRCFVVGANASGKSNFFDALRFLRDIARQGGGLQTAVELRGGLTKIRSLSARVHNDVKIEVELTETGHVEPKWRYTLDIKNQGGGIKVSRAVIIAEEVCDCANDKIIVSRGENDQNEDSETLLYTHLEQATQNAQFRDIRDAFQNIEYLNVVPQLVRESSSVVFAMGKEDFYGRNFLKRMAMLNERTRNNYLKRINEVMVHVVPQLNEITFAKDENGVPHLEAIYKHWRAHGAKQNETAFSDGTIRMIGFLFAMLDGSGTILLEEPEINLHSCVVAQMPEYIAGIQRQKGRQVIVTTHSFDILSNQGIGGDEVLFVESSADGSNLVNVSSREDLMVLLDSGLTVADALINKCAPMDVNMISPTNK